MVAINSLVSTRDMGHAANASVPVPDISSAPSRFGNCEAGDCRERFRPHIFGRGLGRALASVGTTGFEASAGSRRPNG